MPDRFSAFSFVDRITSLEAGIRARARFAIPATLPAFQPCLVVEAVGQLACWVAMADAGFQRRPVAALSRETRILAEAAPGEVLELGVEIERCDPDAVAYGGWARVADTHILELGRCVGPMLPLEDFDAPEAVRGDFETLCGPGARPGRFPGITAPDLSLIDHVPGRRLRAALRVPEAAPFFGDHFPRRPVFPASLLLDAQIRLALRLAAEALPPGRRLRPARVADVKMRSFILPGHAVEIEVGLRSATNAAAELTLTAIVQGQRVATGRIEIVSREPA
jgi:3-hydroxymyristoyl/3-hydroxydecanoyl-(acyl carrier protein) dehydratase